MWHPRGYGGYAKASDAVRVPGFDHALVTDWIGDNDVSAHYGNYLVVT